MAKYNISKEIKEPEELKGGDLIILDSLLCVLEENCEYALNLENGRSLFLSEYKHHEIVRIPSQTKIELIQE